MCRRGGEPQPQAEHPLNHSVVQIRSDTRLFVTQLGVDLPCRRDTQAVPHFFHRRRHFRNLSRPRTFDSPVIVAVGDGTDIRHKPSNRLGELLAHHQDGP